jgi:DNA-directed RNA polymerase subunit RPC12/RpoP
MSGPRDQAKLAKLLEIEGYKSVEALVEAARWSPINVAVVVRRAPRQHDEGGTHARRHYLRRCRMALFRNFYRCAACGHEWTDEWSATHDDDCPHCGARHMSPCKSEEMEAADE